MPPNQPKDQPSPVPSPKPLSVSTIPAEDEPQLTKPPSQEPGQILVSPAPIYQAPLANSAKKSIGSKKVLLIVLLVIALLAAGWFAVQAL